MLRQQRKATIQEDPLNSDGNAEQQILTEHRFPGNRQWCQWHLTFKCVLFEHFLMAFNGRCIYSGTFDNNEILI